jgi:hypothetical protein
LTVAFFLFLAMCSIASESLFFGARRTDAAAGHAAAMPPNGVRHDRGKLCDFSLILFDCLLARLLACCFFATIRRAA